MTHEPRPVQVDLLAQPWYAHENDLIGGWSVLNVDGPPSQADHRADQYEVGSFLGEDTARHIVALHNAHLDGRQLADRLRDEGRVQASDAILAHIRNRFPPLGERNPAQRTFVRHLDVAARVALPQMTREQVARALDEAVRTGRFIACNPPDGDPEADRG